MFLGLKGTSFALHLHLIICALPPVLKPITFLFLVEKMPLFEGLYGNEVNLFNKLGSRHKCQRAGVYTPLMSGSN